MTNPTATEVMQQIIPLGVTETFLQIDDASLDNPNNIYPVSGMNEVRVGGVTNGLEQLETYASDGSISLYYAAMLAIGAPGAGMRPGVMDRDGRTFATDPYVTNAEGELTHDVVKIAVTQEAIRIAEGPRNGDRGTDHTFFLNGHPVLPVSDSTAYTSGFSAEIFGDFDVQQTGDNYHVTIDDVEVSLTAQELADIQRLSFNGDEPNTRGEMALDDPRQHDALDVYGRAKIVAAGIVHARQHEQTDDITYEGSIPSLPAAAQRTSASAARQ